MLDVYANTIAKFAAASIGSQRGLKMYISLICACLRSELPEFWIPVLENRRGSTILRGDRSVQMSEKEGVGGSRFSESRGDDDDDDKLTAWHE